VNDVVIVCPTHARAGSVSALGAFGRELMLCVSESQAPSYREAYPDTKLDVHPDTVVGLGPKMTWMSEKYGTFFRVDDDAGRVIDHSDSSRLDPLRACATVRRLADAASEMGAFLWGMTSDENPLHYSPMDPIRMTGFVDGGKQGITAGSKLWWPDDIDFADDFWISLLNAFEHRFVYIDTRFCVPTKVGQKGGLAAIRTEAEIRKKATLLKAAFGDAVTIKADVDRTFTYPWLGRVPW
jgi:hypothetical protein